MSQQRADRNGKTAQLCKCMLRNIPLHCVKICHYDWSNKKLSAQYLGRILRAEECWEKEDRVAGRC